MHDKIVQEVLEGLIVGKKMRPAQLVQILSQPTVAKTKGLHLGVRLDQLVEILSQLTEANGLHLRVGYVRNGDAPEEAKAPARVVSEKTDKPSSRKKAHKDTGHDPLAKYADLSCTDKALVALSKRNTMTVDSVRKVFGQDGLWSSAFYGLVKRGLARPVKKVGRFKSYRITKKGKTYYESKIVPKIH